MQYLGISPTGPYLGITTNVAEKKVEIHSHDRLTDTSNYHIKNNTDNMGHGPVGEGEILHSITFVCLLHQPHPISTHGHTPNPLDNTQTRGRMETGCDPSNIRSKALVKMFAKILVLMFHH